MTRGNDKQNVRAEYRIVNSGVIADGDLLSYTEYLSCGREEEDECEKSYILVGGVSGVQEDTRKGKQTTTNESFGEGPTGPRIFINSLIATLVPPTHTMIVRIGPWNSSYSDRKPAVMCT